MKKIVIIGANSAIATEVARHFAVAGCELVLCGRNRDRLTRLGEDLKVRGASAVFVEQFDALEMEADDTLIHRSCEALGEIDAVLIAHGLLPNQEECAESAEKTLQALKTNFTSPVLLITAFGKYFEARRQGTIAVISSVAGDRGRQSNYVYGCAKGGLNVFLEGFRNKMFHRGVKVVTIKPGFVDTPMTVHIKKGPLFASPASVGARIHRAMQRGEPVVYTPWFWWPIMLIIKAIPERIFMRLKL